MKGSSRSNPDDLSIKAKLASLYQFAGKKYEAELIYTDIISSTPKIADPVEDVSNSSTETEDLNSDEQDSISSILPELTPLQLSIYGSIIVLLVLLLILRRAKAKADKKFYDNLEDEFDSSDADKEEEAFKQGLQSLDDDMDDSSMSPEQKAQIYELYNQGLTNKEIAHSLSLSVDAVSFIIRENGGIDNEMKKEDVVKEKSYDISGLIPQIRRLYNEGLSAEEIADSLEVDINDVNETLAMISNENVDEDENEDKSEQIKQLASEGLTKNQIAENLKIGIDEVEFAASLFDISFNESQIADLGKIEVEEPAEEDHDLGFGDKEDEDFEEVQIRDVDSEHPENESDEIIPRESSEIFDSDEEEQAPQPAPVDDPQPISEESGDELPPMILDESVEFDETTRF